MAVIPLSKPYALKSATFSIDGSDFTAAVSQVKFDPSVSSTSWVGIGGNTLAGQGKASWSATVGIAQDLDATGLMRYLLENDGEEAQVTFVPASDGPTITATLILAPTAIGGTAGPDVTTASVTMAVVGRPAFTDLP